MRHGEDDSSSGYSSSENSSEDEGQVESRRKKDLVRQYKTLIEEKYKAALVTAVTNNKLLKYREIVGEILDQGPVRDKNISEQGVRRLIANYPLDFKKNTALHYAAYYHCPRAYGADTTDFIRYLYELGVDGTIVNAEGYRADQRGNIHNHKNPLSPAKNDPLKKVIDSNEKSEFLRYLKEGNDPRWYQKIIDGVPVVHYAARHCSVELFCFIAQKVGKATKTKKLKNVLTSTCAGGKHPIHEAAIYGNKAVVERLLEEDSPNVMTSDGSTPLHYAAFSNHQAVCSCLITAGADLRYRSGTSFGANAGKTPDQLGAESKNAVAKFRQHFFSAIASCKINEIKRCLERNHTVIYLHQGGRNVFLHAAYEGRMSDFISALDGFEFRKKLSLKKVVNEFEPETGYTLVAAWLTNLKNRSFNDIEWLSRHGMFDTDSHDENNSTIIHIAAVHNRADLLPKLLEQYRHHLNARNKRRGSPLDIAAGNGHVEVVSILCKAGATDNEITSLKAAILATGMKENVKIEIIKTLLSHRSRLLNRDQLNQLINLAIKQKCSVELIRLFATQDNADMNWHNKNRDLPLIQTIISQPDNITLAEALVGWGADVTIKDHDGDPLMHTAATYSAAMVHWLVDKGRSLTQEGDDRWRPYKLNRGGAGNYIQDYISEIKRYINGKTGKPKHYSKPWLSVPDKRGVYLMHFAAATGNVDALKEMRSMCNEAEWAALVNQKLDRNRDCRTPLASAVRSEYYSTSAGRRIEAIAFLLQQGADPTIFSIVDENYSECSLPLFAFCFLQQQSEVISAFVNNCDIDLMRQMVNQIFDIQWPNERIIKQVSLLNAAILHNASKNDIIDLLRLGADVSVPCKAYNFCPTSKHRTLITLYQQFIGLIKSGRSSDILEFLEKYNPTWLKIVDPKTKLTPIHLLAKLGHSTALADLAALTDLAEQYPEIVKPLLSQKDGTRQELTPLMHAVCAKHANTVQFFVDQKVDLDAQDSRGNTAYHHAVLTDDITVVESLENAGISREIRNNAGKTAEQIGGGFTWLGGKRNILAARESQKEELKHSFNKAVERDDVGTVLRLQSTHPHLFEKPDIVLALAAKYGSYQVFQALGQICISNDGNDEQVKRFINIYCDDSTENKQRGESFIHHIIRAQRSDLLDWFIEHGANVNLKPFNSDLFPIWIAVRYGDIAAVNKLLENGSDPNCTPSTASSPLSYAVNYQMKNIAEILLCAKANPKARVTENDQNTRPCDIQGGYVRHKGQVILDTIQALAKVQNDYEALRVFQGVQSLEKYNTRSQDIRRQLGESIPVVTQLSRVFNSYVLIALLARPMHDLATIKAAAQRNQREYQSVRAELIASVLKPILKQHNLVLAGGRVIKLRALAIKLSQIDVELGAPLCQSYNDDIVPEMKIFVDGNDKVHMIDLAGFDYATVTVKQIQTYQQHVPPFERKVKVLEASCVKVKRQILQKQAETYRQYQQLIDEFNRLMTTLPPDIRSWTGGFLSSRKSLDAMAIPCVKATAGLKVLAVEDRVLRGEPSIEQLKANQQHLAVLEGQLPELVKKLQAAESEHKQSVQRRAEAEKFKQLQSQQQQQERQYQTMAAEVRSNLGSVNRLLFPIKKILRLHNESPLHTFILTGVEPTEKLFYTEALKAVVRKAREQYAALCRHVNVSSSMLEDFATETDIAWQAGSRENLTAFFETVGALKESLAALKPLLHTAVQLEQKERQLCQNIVSKIVTINASLAAMRETLGEKEPKLLPALNEYRSAVRSDRTGLHGIAYPTDYINRSDIEQIEQLSRLIERVETEVVAYHHELDKEGAEKNRRQNELRKKIKYQVKQINAVLTGIRNNLKTMPGLTLALEKIPSFREKVKLVPEGLEDIVVPDKFLSGLDEKALTTLLEEAGEATEEASDVRQMLQRRLKAAKEKEALQSKIKKAKQDVNKRLMTIQTLLGKTPFELQSRGALTKLRSALGCTSEGLEELTIAEAQLIGNEAGTLGKLLYEVKQLSKTLALDEKSLRHRNCQSLLQTVWLQDFNKQLEKLGEFVKSADIMPSNVKDSISRLEKQLGIKREKPFDAFTIDPEKAEVIPIEKHEIIAREFESLTQELRKKVLHLTAQRETERKVARAYEQSIHRVEAAVNDLNKQIAVVNQALKKGGEVSEDLVEEIDKLRDTVEKPHAGFFSSFGFSKVRAASTTRKLETVVFDQATTKARGKEALSSLQEQVTRVATSLQEAQSNLNEFQTLKATLREQKQQIKECIEQLSESETTEATNFIRRNLDPTLTSTSLSDMYSMEQTRESAERHLEILQGLVKEKKEQREQAENAVRKNLATVNGRIANLRKKMGGADQDVGATADLRDIRQYLGDSGTGLADLIPGEHFFGADFNSQEAVEKLSDVNSKVLPKIATKIQGTRRDLYKQILAHDKEVKEGITALPASHPKRDDLVKARKENESKKTAIHKNSTVAELATLQTDYKKLLEQVVSAKPAPGLVKSPALTRVRRVTPKSQQTRRSSGSRRSRPTRTTRSPRGSSRGATVTPQASPTRRKPSPMTASTPSPKTKSLHVAGRDDDRITVVDSQSSPLPFSPLAVSTPVKSSSLVSNTSSPNKLSSQQASPTRRKPSPMTASTPSPKTKSLHVAGRDDDRITVVDSQSSPLPFSPLAVSTPVKSSSLVSNTSSPNKLLSPGSASQQKRTPSSSASRRRQSRTGSRSRRRDSQTRLSISEKESDTLSPRERTRSSRLGSSQSRSPSPSTVTIRPTPGVDADRLREQLKKDNAALLDILTVFRDYLRVMRYSFKYHLEFVFTKENGGLSSAEKYHLTEFIVWLNTIHISLNADIERIEVLPEWTLEKAGRHVKLIEETQQKLEEIFQSLRQNGTAQYPHLQKRSMHLPPRMTDPMAIFGDNVPVVQRSKETVQSKRLPCLYDRETQSQYRIAERQRKIETTTRRVEDTTGTLCSVVGVENSVSNLFDTTARFLKTSTKTKALFTAVAELKADRKQRKAVLPEFKKPDQRLKMRRRSGPKNMRRHSSSLSVFSIGEKRHEQRNTNTTAEELKTKTKEFGA